jgi:hypothetical protein
MSKYNSNSQAAQDLFVIHVLKNKTQGTFIEIGSHDPILINNSYMLEKDFGWSGIMFDMDDWSEQYKSKRPNSSYVIADATTINFQDLFANTVLPTGNKLPSNIDYLQIDLHVSNRSTLDVLEHLDQQVMDNYKFATVTFEHDIYTGNHFNTRALSREIFERRGYFRVFSDVMNDHNPYEDWYVHPDLVDMDYIHKIKRDVSLNWKQIIPLLD